MTVSVSKGFTMVELMITISIASILLAVAVPSYQSLMRESRLTAQANELMTALHYARSEAVKRGGRITICKSSDGATCNDGSWQDGWLVFSDAGTAGAVDSDDEILRVFPKLSGGITVNGFGFGNWISYLPNGRSQTGRFELCNQASGRDVVVNNSGRPRVVKDSPCLPS
ncbi:GspH/FimT family pseudopilin [Nitrosomonas eutropha]|uniref:GspH/FimT family pseudopilin n=1 Tax=Nitrosomonas eutropha TaxID=916 RepID=UPI0008C974E0|nr:Tfp pilus assembly protein FimT/FimU [Nitrosomonas eutropha]SEJ23685.1 type IV fimbrial biogenesis protein FimT [Nitrosomonas eutropha]